MKIFYNFLECAADWRNKFERDEKKLEKKNSFKFKIVQSSEEEQQAARPIL